MPTHVYFIGPSLMVEEDFGQVNQQLNEHEAGLRRAWQWTSSCPAFSASASERLRWQRGGVPDSAVRLTGGRWRRVARPGRGGRPARARGGVVPHCAAGEPPVGQWPVG